jgi:hypothetical protein
MFNYVKMRHIHNGITVSLQKQKEQAYVGIYR